jgi:hypothetical protein
MTLLSRLLLVLGVLGSLASHAEAQLSEGDLRIWMDADVLAVGVVREKPEGGTRNNTTVVSVGPNQLGNSRVLLATPAVGVGVAYVLKPKWMLGARTGLGFDRVAFDHQADEKRVAFSLMPELTFVPFGDDAKMFLKFSPIAQYNRIKRGSDKAHIFMGCFSVGGGMMWFRGRGTSIDLGAYFEGRFGTLKDPSDAKTDVDDLRGLLRLSFSLWT